jgi:hypothetical protein
VAGSVDAIAVVVFFALVRRPRRTLLFVEMSAAAVIAAVIILPFDLLFAAILAVAVVPLVTYPDRRDVQALPSWWAGVPRLPVILAALAGVVAAGDRRHRAAPRDSRNGSGGSGELVVRLRRTRHDIGRRRSARRQPRTRLAHPQVHLRWGVALPWLGRHAGPPAPHRIVGIRGRYRRNPRRSQFRTSRLARSGAKRTAICGIAKPELRRTRLDGHVTARWRIQPSPRRGRVRRHGCQVPNGALLGSDDKSSRTPC